MTTTTKRSLYNITINIFNFLLHIIVCVIYKRERKNRFIRMYVWNGWWLLTSFFIFSLSCTRIHSFSFFPSICFFLSLFFEFWVWIGELCVSQHFKYTLCTHIFVEFRIKINHSDKKKKKNWKRRIFNKELTTLKNGEAIDKSSIWKFYVVLMYRNANKNKQFRSGIFYYFVLCQRRKDFILFSIYY